MAHVTLLELDATAFMADDEPMITGDAEAEWVQNVKGRPSWAFDATDEEAIISAQLVMPGEYEAGTLKADLIIYAASATSSNFRFDVLVEAYTPGTDNTDLDSTADGFDSANGGSQALASTAGRPYTLTITLSNKDSVVAGDTFRLLVRRDTDHADDAATGDAYFVALDLWEDK